MSLSKEASYELSMVTLTKREVAAIRSRLRTGSAQNDPRQEDEEHRLIESKSESEALHLKQDGNDHFRKKNFLAAIHRYTRVAG